MRLIALFCSLTCLIAMGTALGGAGALLLGRDGWGQVALGLSVAAICAVVVLLIYKKHKNLFF